MSAIAGILSSDRTLARAGVVSRMLDAMPHRGPDGSGTWSAPGIALGYLALNTTPESNYEQQPFTIGDCTIVADARIDNRDDLLERLGLSPSTPDGVLILRAWLAWGADCVSRLLGDFAFAIWDDSSSTLFCARDHFGMKPFYYHDRGRDGFVFGTEIKALLQVDSVPERLNEQRVVDYLTSVRNDATETIYQDIFRLPAAHTLTLNTDGISIDRYWSLEPADLSDLTTDDEYRDRFLELFREAVRCRVRSTAPLGTELSGGLDSSFVSCMARDEIASVRTGDLHSYTVTYDSIPECSERDYFDAVLNDGGFTPHYVSGDDAGPLTFVDELYGSALDDFLVGGNYVVKWKMCSAARESGVRVMLSGTDGDTVVQHGILYLKELARDHQWEELSRQISALSDVYATADHTHPFQDELKSQSALYVRYVLGTLHEFLVEGRMRDFRKGLREVPQYFRVSKLGLLKMFSRPLLKSLFGMSVEAHDATPHVRPAPLLSQAAARRFDIHERLAAYRASEQRLFESVRDKQRITLERAEIAGAFEAANHMSAYFGIEPRYPFMDVRLVEFCLALPSDQSLKNGWTRRVMRRAMEGIVPDKVRLRVGKTRLAEGFRNGLIRVDAKNLEKHVLSTGVLERFVDTTYVKELFETRDTLDQTGLERLSTVAVMSSWLKTRFGAGDGFTETRQSEHESLVISSSNARNHLDSDQEIAILHD